jgi:hypothetical protein
LEQKGGREWSFCCLLTTSTSILLTCGKNFISTVKSCCCWNLCSRFQVFVHSHFNRNLFILVVETIIKLWLNSLHLTTDHIMLYIVNMHLSECYIYFCDSVHQLSTKLDLWNLIWTIELIPSKMERIITCSDIIIAL